MSIFRSPAKTILFSGFIAGTLDILCAIFFLAGGNAAGVFRFIAKGAFGSAAFEGGPEMLAWGAAFHYFIALSFAAGYFLVYPFVPLLGRHRIISGLLYGAFIWGFMNYLVLPLTYNPPAPFAIHTAWKGIVILMLAVGLPVSLITSHYYTNPKRYS